MELVERSLYFRTHAQVDKFPIYACPACHNILENSSENVLRCPQEGTSFTKKNNIWRFLPPNRAEHYKRFMQEYEKIRQAEGRGCKDPAFYLELPFKDLSGKFVEDWKIRSISYLTLVKKIVQPLHKRTERPLKILDLGAGNGWLSNRLTHLGHQVVALDILTNTFDGLGACVHYPRPFALVQSEFDRTPFSHGLFDLIIFNASWHYSESYVKSLQEALRILDRNGRVVILDSPIYNNPNSGAQMVQERANYFLKSYGLPSDALKSENYLTFQKLAALAKRFNLSWRVVKPNYGWKWRLKPLQARIRRRREPAQFLILEGRKN
ncbi:MAG: class I SAM-dependent methyltransferase [bacterium]